MWYLSHAEHHAKNRTSLGGLDQETLFFYLPLTYKRVHTHAHTHVHMYTHKCTHMHIHTYTHNSTIDLHQICRHNKNAKGTYGICTCFLILSPISTWSWDVYGANFRVYACKVERACPLSLTKRYEWSGIWKIAS